MKVIKVLKDGMTIGELRVVNLDDVSNVEYKLIHIILDYADNGGFFVEDDEDTAKIFFSDDIVEMGRCFGNFYFSRFDQNKEAISKVNNNGAIQVELQNVIDAIEKAGDGETINGSDFWDAYNDDDVEAAKVVLKYFSNECYVDHTVESHDYVWSLMNDEKIKIIRYLDDLEDIRRDGKYDSCKYHGEEYYYVTDDIDMWNDFHYVGLIKKDLVDKKYLK